MSNPYALTHSARQYLDDARRSAHGQLLKARGALEGGVGHVKSAAVISAGAFGTQYLNARMGGPEGAEVLGLPLPLVAAGIGYAVAMTEAAGEYSEDVMGLAVGSLAGFAAQKGADAGAKAYAEKGGAVAGGYQDYPRAVQDPAAVIDRYVAEGA